MKAVLRNIMDIAKPILFFVSIILAAFLVIYWTTKGQAQISVVIDGDTFITDKGEHIRLYGVDCPERNQPFGVQARDFSYKYIDRSVTLDRRGRDKYGRTIASIVVDTKQDLAKMLVSNGLAWVYKKYSSPELYDLMLQARASRIGLWSQYSEPPFKYREKHENIN